MWQPATFVQMLLRRLIRVVAKSLYNIASIFGYIYIYDLISILMKDMNVNTLSNFLGVVSIPV